VTDETIHVYPAPPSSLDALMNSNWGQFRADLWNDIEGWAYEARDALGIAHLHEHKNYTRDYFWIAGPPPMDVAEYERRHPY
jgi:hypothetical protein